MALVYHGLGFANVLVLAVPCVSALPAVGQGKCSASYSGITMRGKLIFSCAMLPGSFDPD